MSTTEPVPQPEGTKPERLKRGSFPPFLGLADAFDLARAIYEQGGGRASVDLLSRLTGNSSSSSNFVKKIGALKLYGIVSEQNGAVALTEQGNSIAAPISEDADLQARKASFLNVATFSRLFDRHKGKLLPADEFLRNILEQDIGIPQELSAEWLRAFKEGLKVAGLLYTRADGKTQVLELPGTSADVQPIRPTIADNGSASPSIDISTSTAVPTASQSVPISASGNNTRFELSDGRVAEFRVPFGITARDAKRLKGFLKGLELIIDSAVIGEQDSST
jgi:hypothetical protein